MSPDHVIKGTYSSNEAAQPTEPSACPADWILLGNINTWTRPWVEDRRKLCPLHTHNSSSREWIQAEMTPGQTILSPKALGSLKSLRQSRASDACVMAHLEPSTCSRVTRAGTERWKTSTVPSWGCRLGALRVTGGGDIQSQEAAGLTWHNRGLGLGSWGREKAGQTQCTERAPWGQRGDAKMQAR